MQNTTAMQEEGAAGPPPDEERTPLSRIDTVSSRVREVAKHFPYWIFPLLSGFFWFGESSPPS